MTQPFSAQTPRGRTTALIVTEVGDETIVYDMTTNNLHTLNATASSIWRLCDGQTTVAAIALRFAQERHIEDSEIFVWSALEQLAQQGLLEQPARQPEWLAGITRRELMTRAAATLVALPLVKSLAAPMPAYARSPIAPTTSAPTTLAPTTTTTTTTLAPTTTTLPPTTTTTLPPLTTASP